jgi:hypothetical protein
MRDPWASRPRSNEALGRECQERFAEGDMRYAVLLAILMQTRAYTSPSRDTIMVGPSWLGSDDGHTSLEFDLTNSTDRAITAWTISIQAERSDGTAKQVGMGKDAYAAYAGLIPDRGDFIRPHATVHFSERLSDLFGTSPPDPAQRFLVTVTCVIFADRTWTGDAAKVKAYFADRERAYVALTDVITALRKARVNAVGIDALRAALSELNKPGQRDPDSSIKTRMRTNLETAIKMSSRDPAGADENMGLWLSSAEARLQATQDHKLQGPPAEIK